MATRKTIPKSKHLGHDASPGEPGKKDLTAYGVGKVPDAVAPGPDFSGVTTATNENQLDMLRTMAQTLRDKTREFERVSALAEIAAADLARFQMVTIPEAMELAGVTSFMLEGGAELLVKDDCKVNIKKELAVRDEAHAWLRANGHGGAIKVYFNVDVRALTEKQRASLEKKIVKAGVACEHEESVHNAALKSLVKELLEKGTTLPPSISVFQFKKAELKEPKAK